MMLICMYFWMKYHCHYSQILLHEYKPTLCFFSGLFPSNDPTSQPNYSLQASGTGNESCLRTAHVGVQSYDVRRSTLLYVVRCCSMLGCALLLLCFLLCPNCFPTSRNYRGRGRQEWANSRSNSLGKFDEKRKEMRKRKQWILHHDNAPGHSALNIRQFLASRQVATLDHLSCSLNLTPSDCFLFPKLKSVLKLNHFDAIDDIKDQTTTLPRTMKEDFSPCFNAWKMRMQMSIDQRKDYFEGIHHWLCIFLRN